jgi:CBS domain-containing protein
LATISGGQMGNRPANQRAHRAQLTVSFLSLSTEPVTQAHPDAPLAVSADATVGDVVQLMRAEKGSCALICDDDGKLAGIFTERDALRWMSEGSSASMSIREAMTPDPARLDSKTSVGLAIETMAEGGYRHLPIVDERGVPAGVAAVRGIVQFLVDHFPETIYTLPPEPGKKPSERDGG